MTHPGGVPEVDDPTGLAATRRDLDGTALPGLNRLARSSIKLMLGRQAIVQAIGLVAGIILARVLTPAEFGLFAIVMFVVGASELLSTFGVAPALIQRRESLTDRDLRVAFTIQQATTSAAVVALWIAAPRLAGLYTGSTDVVWLIRVLAISLYLNSWRSMSTLQLERHLRYSPLARIEVVEAFVFQVVAVGFALAGFGVWSFVWAVLARGVVGTVLTFAVAPWSPRFAFDRSIGSRIVRFGAPFQLQSMTKLASDWVTPVLVGAYSGARSVGLLTFAQSNAGKPLLLVESVMRVAFPHFSRIQHDRDEVQRILDKYLVYLLLPAGLWFTTILVAGPLVVPLVYTDKWSAAVPSLIIFSFAMIGDVFSWVLAVSLTSLGLVGRVTRITLLRIAVFVTLSIILLQSVGFIAVPIAYAVSKVATVPLLMRLFGPGSIRRLSAPLLRVSVPIGLGAVVGGCALLLPIDGVARAVIVTCVTAATYALFSWLMFIAPVRRLARNANVRAVGAA